MSASIRETVDFARCPIDLLDSDEGRALVEQMQAALTENGACELPGFLTPDAIDDAVTRGQRLGRERGPGRHGQGGALRRGTAGASTPIEAPSDQFARLGLR